LTKAKSERLPQALHFRQPDSHANNWFRVQVLRIPLSQNLPLSFVTFEKPTEGIKKAALLPSPL